MTKRHAGNALLILGSVAACCLILEAALRLYSGIPVLAATNFVAQSLDIVRANTGYLNHDELLGWRLKDGINADGFTTSEFGIRNNGARRPVPPEAIIAVGDSFTAGSGVRDEETWPAQLERALAIPVINGAAGAWGVDQMILRAETLAERVRPTAIVVGVMAWDSHRNGYVVFGGGYKPWFDIQDGVPVLKGVPVPQFEHAPQGLGRRRGIFGHSWLVHWSMMRLGLMDRWIGAALLEARSGFRRLRGYRDIQKLRAALVSATRTSKPELKVA